METYDAGLATLRQLFGADRADAIRGRWEALSPAFEREGISVVLGRTWSRGNIDVKTRALCSIGILAAQGRQAALKLIFELALRNGVTSEEIDEALLQVAIYAGYPAALDALALLEGLRSRAGCA